MSAVTWKNIASRDDSANLSVGSNVIQGITQSGQNLANVFTEYGIRKEKETTDKAMTSLLQAQTPEEASGLLDQFQQQGINIDPKQVESTINSIHSRQAQTEGTDIARQNLAIKQGEFDFNYGPLPGQTQGGEIGIGSGVQAGSAELALQGAQRPNTIAGKRAMLGGSSAYNEAAWTPEMDTGDEVQQLNAIQKTVANTPVPLQKGLFQYLTQRANISGVTTEKQAADLGESRLTQKRKDDGETLIESNIDAAPQEVFDNFKGMKQSNPKMTDEAIAKIDPGSLVGAISGTMQLKYGTKIEALQNSLSNIVASGASGSELEGFRTEFKGYGNDMTSMINEVNSLGSEHGIVGDSLDAEFEKGQSGYGRLVTTYNQVKKLMSDSAVKAETRSQTLADAGAAKLIVKRSQYSSDKAFVDQLNPGNDDTRMGEVNDIISAAGKMERDIVDEVPGMALFADKPELFKEAYINVVKTKGGIYDSWLFGIERWKDPEETEVIKEMQRLYNSGKSQRMYVDKSGKASKKQMKLMNKYLADPKKSDRVSKSKSNDNRQSYPAY